MADGDTSLDPHEKLVRDWTLSLLRFAVTHEPADQAAALALASELDSRHGHGKLTFFQRTSATVCHAILVRDREGERTLAQHIRRIDHPRLKRAFAAAVRIDDTTPISKGKYPTHRIWRRAPRI